MKMKTGPLAIIAALLTVLSVSGKEDLRPVLAELDAAIVQRDIYIANRELRINSLKSVLQQSDFSNEQRYALNRQLIEEYIPYQADSTINIIYQNIDLAQKLKDTRKLAESRIKLAYLYSSSGIYLEAAGMLNEIDTATLDNDLLTEYYISRHKLNDELELYSHDFEQSEKSGVLAEFYARLIVEKSEPESETCLKYELWQAMRNQDFDAAEKIVDKSLSIIPPHSRRYATAAYMKALIASAKQDIRTAQIWYARSAMADIQLAIRDNASLKNLANTLLDDNNIQRAMRYMRVVMDDARFFNSRLRPWQDAQALHTIEDAYNKRKERMDMMYNIFTISVITFMLLAIVGALFWWRQNRKLRLARAELLQAYHNLNASNDNLQEINSRLITLNGEISEANKVKEEYIGIFLAMCSEYIDKISESRRRVRRMLRDGKVQELRKEYDSSDGDTKELEEFYRNFDITFLRLYPTFIEEFNSLLEEEGRIEPRKGELLTTELRIFALIRLGIADSSKIAALLRYSVSTIYNYRSKIKGYALLSRDEFEEKIKIIGAFSD